MQTKVLPRKFVAFILKDKSCKIILFVSIKLNERVSRAIAEIANSDTKLCET